MDTRLQRTAELLSPELRIVSYILYIISLFAFPYPAYYLVLAFIALLIMITLPRHILKSGWIPIGTFLLFSFIGNLINHPGKVLYGLGPVIITNEGLTIAFIRTMRIALMIAGVKILMAVTLAEDVINALSRMLSPIERTGVRINNFFYVLGLTMKCFPILQDKITSHYNENIKASKGKNMFEKARTVATFLLPFFVESIISPEVFFDDIGKT